MVTLVGTQSNFITALQELLELEYIASETYEAAINRLEDTEYKDKLSQFKADHQRHIQQLSSYLKKHKADVPQGPTGKQIMTISKVAIGKLFGDQAILQAMHDAEDDTNTAYERITQHKSKTKDCDEIVNAALADERKHRAWVEKTINQLKKAS